MLIVPNIHTVRVHSELIEQYPCAQCYIVCGRRLIIPVARARRRYIKWVEENGGDSRILGNTEIGHDEEESITGTMGDGDSRE